MNIENATTQSFDADWSAFVGAFLRHDRAAPDLLSIVIDNHPAEPMGPLAKGFALVLLAKAELLPAARAALAEGMRRLSGRDDRQLQTYAAGLRCWLAGDPENTILALERIIAAHPLDAFAVKLSHAIRFMTGDADGMRRSLARVVSIYTDQTPFAGYIKGCYAFALEETGDCAAAESMGRRAVDLTPDDAWGRHAVAHVMEMTGRARDGISWLGEADRWAHCNNFGYHLFWHKALFHLELGENSAALALYDAAIRDQHTDDFRDIANASSLLQRLEIAGMSVGQRWDELADIAERRINDRCLVFADLHYVLSLAGAGRFSTIETMIDGMLSVNEPAGTPTRESQLSHDVGSGIAAGIVAFRAGRHAEVISLMEPVMHRLQGIGGSHAQRDVFHQIYLESLVRSGDPSASAVLSGRLKARNGTNRFASQRLERLLAGSERGQVALSVLAGTKTAEMHQ